MSTPRKNVTLLTLAEDLGVSRATISNAYSRPDHVSAALRDRILERAAELGYGGPHAGASALRRGRAGAIGLIFAEELRYAFADPAINQFLEGVATSIAEEKLSLLMIASEQARDAAVVQQALVDGFILYSIPANDPFAEMALQRGLPTVCVDHPRAKGSPLIGMADRAAAKAAVMHLLDLGHRDLAVIMCDPTPSRSVDLLPFDVALRTPYGVTRARLQGVADACGERGISLPSVARSAYNTAISGAEAAGLLFAGHEPTAVLTMSDLLAAGAIQETQRTKRRVPQDLSVIGFDDLSIASTTRPAITTVRQDLLAKGQRAGETIVALLAGRAARGTNVPWELIVRDSTASPK